MSLVQAIGWSLVGAGLVLVVWSVVLSQRSRAIKGSAALFTALLATLGLAELAASVKGPRASVGGTWGYAPGDRAVFRCLTPRNCPGPPYPSLNAYVNAPNYGDERSFLDVRNIRGTESDWRDELWVVPGDVVEFRIYVNNSGGFSAESRDDAGITAKGVAATLLLPHNEGHVLMAAVNLEAANTQPPLISDTAVLRSRKPIALEYVFGSARLVNRLYPDGRTLSSDYVRGPGVLLGYKSLDGRLRGSFAERAFVLAAAKVVRAGDK